ncbi:MAG: glycosyltransferase family 2 protein [Anaerolineaceae bacterium]|nr:glycosyltransferase family 2 protein [Anaerolineaceae bacterium]
MQLTAYSSPSPENERTIVMIPARDEAAALAAVIRGVRNALPEADILVMDDHSEDDTARIAREQGALLLRLPIHVGIGAAVQAGLQFAHRRGYRRALRCDGDGQHPAETLRALLDPLQADAADVVTGSRYLQPGGFVASPWRRLGSYWLATEIGLLTGQRVTDPTSGLSAFNERAIALFAEEYPPDYPEPEAIVALRRAGLRLREVPAKMRARQGGSSSITTLLAAYYMLKVSLAVLVMALRRRP